MYTRSYPRQESRKDLTQNENPFAATKQQQILTDSSIPEGYSGTAILRESEKTEMKAGEFIEGKSFSTNEPHISATASARRFKVATKITPSLWFNKGSDNLESTDAKSNGICHETAASNLCNEIASEAFQKDSFGNETLSEKRETESFIRERRYGEENYTNTESNSCETGFSTDSCNKSENNGHPRRGIKKRRYGNGKKSEERCLGRKRGGLTDEKTLFNNTSSFKLRDRNFSLEDLLLGGLILLLLNEGADDDVILIFGFLLFSSL